MTISPHMLLAKRQEQERDRLATELANLLLLHKAMQEDIEAARKEQSDIEAQLKHAFSVGMPGSQLVAMECARQESIARRESLSLQCEQLRGQERDLRQQMLICENKGKAHAQAQEKLDRHEKRRSERAAQQQLDDLMAQRLGREAGR